jgi:hypothetical protein
MDARLAIVPSTNSCARFIDRIGAIGAPASCCKSCNGKASRMLARQLRYLFHQAWEYVFEKIVLDLPIQRARILSGIRLTLSANCVCIERDDIRGARVGAQIKM